ncbi:YesL family protein [Metabacillus malikii]|uniref:Membrane protein YesL n=1 Tax=Metabacillus malikii TaxID=1504265 RepID=A0ABT9ZGS0_9BACI|nr:DUF624 domain-containing protein [Metabacillus malikii]MDQ0230733.1 putative membrane protein YesL [Metabacillus malikii]
MEMNGLMGGFYKFSVIFTRIVVTNMMWLLFNLPILYVLLSLIGSNFANLQTTGILLAILTPCVFFPATAAMYGIARKWVMGEGDIPVIRSYLRYYKENYRKSLLGGIVFVLFWSGWLVNYLLFFKDQSPLILAVFFIITAFFFTWNSHYFSYIVHFELRFVTMLKNTFILTISNPFSTVGVALIAGAFVYMSSSLTFLLPIGIGSLIAYFSYFYFYKIIQKTILKIESRKASVNQA